MDISLKGRGRWRRLLFGSDPRVTLVRVLIWAVLTFLFFHHLLLPIKIIGSSMSPTYRHGSVNFINRMAYLRQLPRRGDVVAIRLGNELLLKRIVGLPGEAIQIDDGTIIINGTPLDDEFALSRVWCDRPVKTRLGTEEFFVIGDNRQTSWFAKIRKDEIIGRIVF